MESKQKISVINVVLIIMLVLCVIMGGAMIALSKSKTELEIAQKSTDKIKNSNTTTETNTWDVSENEDGSVIATLEDDGTLIISGTGNMASWSSSSSVPWNSVSEQIKNIKIEEGITSISSLAFCNCINLITIQIPSSMTSIGSRAFDGCESLTSIEIPEGVTSIGMWAFSDCESLTSIEIPEGVTTIESFTFNGCESLTSVEIPEGVEIIGACAFYSCQSLRNIEIPSSVTSIGNGAFNGISWGNFESINVNKNNTSYMDDNGVLYTKDGTELIKYPQGKAEGYYKILSNTTIIGDNAFEFCEKLTNVEIPSSVTTIGHAAFVGCEGLREIKIPESVTTIEDKAFAYCYLRNLELPNSLTYIYSNIFSECCIVNFTDQTANGIELPEIFKRAQDENDILYSNSGFELTNCIIEDSKIKINEGAEYAILEVVSGNLNGLSYKIYYNTWDISEAQDGSVVAVLSNDGTLSISGSGNMKDYEEFYYKPWCGVRNYIEKIDIKDGVKNIERNAFRECDYLKSVKIPSSVMSIGNSAFENCARLVNVEIANGVSNIGDYAFCGCAGLTSIELPNSVTSIRNGAFEWCFSLKDIKIPDNVTYIGPSAFYSCDSLQEIEIPSSVTNIGDAAFSYCWSLTGIYVDENNNDYMDDDGVLYTKDKTQIISYPNGKLESNYSILNGVNTINYSAFDGSENLTNIVIPDSVTFIDEYAFAECYNLKNILIPSSVTDIAEDVFWGSDNVTIWCKKGSTAHTYAQENEINYLLIMDGIKPKTTAQQINGYKIFDLNGSEVTDTSMVVTGYTAQAEDGENYIIIVTGDCNGDGQADIKDILAINKHRLNKVNLTIEYLLAGDVNEDSQADIKDILQINKFRLGKISEL